LQILQENFPRGTLVTLTPWEPQEIWPLVSAALTVRPAVIAPFVTRPSEEILDREARGLANACSATSGVYLLHPSEGRSDAVVVLQGSDVAYAFVQDALPLLAKEGIGVEVYYVASAELYDLLPVHEQERIFPEALAQKAMGITGFTLPTMYRWVRSDQGRRATLHAFQRGHYLGSGQAEDVLAEAGLDGESQFKAIAKYVKGRQDRKTPS
jgi:transketolase